MAQENPIIRKKSLQNPKIFGIKSGFTRILNCKKTGINLKFNRLLA